MTRWHADIADELREAFEACLPAHRFTLGPNLREFEAEFAAYCGATAGIGISSGTAALALALRALGIGPGDEVITVPNTYVATVFAITYVGALPVFVDVDPVTANIDPARVAAAADPGHQGHPARAPLRSVRGHGRPARGGAGHPHPGGRRARPRRHLRRAPRRQPGRDRGLQLLPVQGHGRPG